MEPKIEVEKVVVPFDVQMAKRIQDGEVEGEIYDSHYNCGARIVDFDFKAFGAGKLNIGVSHLNDNEEIHFICNDEGVILLDREKEFDDTPVIKLRIPEYLTFKDGDVVNMGWNNRGEYCSWIAIIKDIDSCGEIYTHNYVTMCLSASKGHTFKMSFDDSSDAATWVVRATEDETLKLVEELQNSKDPRAQKCLELLLKNNPKLSNSIKIVKNEFKPFDKVLVRDSEAHEWKIDIFRELIDDGDDCGYKYVCFYDSWNYCIPFEGNEHLLGKTESNIQ